jgi:tetratricopeptide (TPR) repeat protein
VTAHPSPDELKALVRGGISQRKAKEVLVHLFEGCQECFAVVEPELPLAFGAGPAEVTPEAVEAYSDPVERAIAKACRHQRYLQKEHEKVPHAAEVLEREGLEVVFAPHPGLSGLALYEALLEKSWALRREKPAEMVRYARGAAFVATTLDKRRLGKRRWSDLQARAWGELANAHRAADDLDEAGVVFDRAFELFRRGTGDKALEARLHDLQASYYGTRRWFKLALKSLDAVHAIHIRNGDSRLVGRALVSKALYTIYSGQPEAALSLLDEALSMIDEGEDPQLTCDALHNRLLALVDCGRFPEARKFLFLHAARFNTFSGKVNHIRINALRARIDLGMGAFDSAERGFLEVKQAMEEVGKGFAVALATLELALVHMHQSRLAESNKEATEAGEVFRSLGVHRELLVALGVVQRSFEIGIATVPLLESVVEYVRRAEHDPGVRFEPRF